MNRRKKALQSELCEHIRHDDNGVVARFGAEDDFIDQARTLAVNPLRIDRLRRSARASAETIDWERVIDALEDTLDSVARANSTQVNSALFASEFSR